MIKRIALIVLLAASTVYAQPVVESEATWVDVNLTTLPCDFTLNAPSGVSNGDLLVAVFAWDNARSVDEVGADWTLADDRGGSGGSDYAVYYLVVDGSVDYTFSVSAATNLSGTVFRISGAEDPDTTAMVHSAWTQGSSGDIDIPDITPAANNSLLMIFAGRGEATISSVTPPSSPWTTSSGGGSTYNTTKAAYRTLASGTPGITTVEYDQAWQSDVYGSMFSIAPSASGSSIAPIQHHHLRRRR